jgi:hypothetical protein
MEQDGTPTDFDHWLGAKLGFFTQTGSFAAAKHHNLHAASSPSVHVDHVINAVNALILWV